MKYQTPDDQSEILPNLLNLTSKEDIGLSEFEGFLNAEIVFSEKISRRTKFNLKYIHKLHELALGHLYSFAGKYRDVNISKGGFPFAAAKFLPSTMLDFERNLLNPLPNNYSTKNELIADIAKVHGELLFIHPFREGNGRTARILANLMALKQGFEPLYFDKIGKKEFEFYVLAVQKCADKDYSNMEDFIQSIFPV
ncbi:MAG: cell filamentation protein Fic [Bacteroidetes bacterium]|nr:cell filamentation protein Fic [Bacteroidota bacterium]